MRSSYKMPAAIQIFSSAILVSSDNMAFTNVCICLFLCFLFCLSSSSIAITPPSPRALLLPVTKDPSTKQYIVQIKQRTPFVPVKLALDLGGESLWVDCGISYVSSTYKPLHCRSSLCSLLKSTWGCGECYPGPRPGCMDHPCAITPGCNNHSCHIWPENSITRTNTLGEVAKDVVSLQSTDGSNPGPIVSVPELVFTCADTSLLQGLAKGVKGMAGLGRTPIGLPSQFSNAFNFPQKFAMCLSSSTGVLFFGDGPYIMLPGIDVSTGLTYTPLIMNHVGAPWTKNVEGNDPSGEYFIGVKGIRVDGELVPINKTLLQINKEGYGGTKISTVVPYTTMETSIYNAVTNAFVNSIAKFPRVAERVKAVAPFKVCYRSNTLDSTRVGYSGPPITLVLQNETTSWTFFGSNAFVTINNAVVCLGILDGGVGQVTSIVIGGHQLQNAVLEFDLARSRLGFTPSLLGSRTSCNFNFTS